MKITTTTALVIVAAWQTGTTINTEQLGKSKEQYSPPGLSSFTYTLVASCSPTAAACKGLREKVDISSWSWASYDKAGDLFGHSDRPANLRDTHGRYADPATRMQDRALQELAAGKRNDIDRVHTEPIQPLSKNPRYSGFFYCGRTQFGRVSPPHPSLVIRRRPDCAGRTEAQKILKKFPVRSVLLWGRRQPHRIYSRGCWGISRCVLVEYWPIEIGPTRDGGESYFCRAEGRPRRIYSAREDAESIELSMTISEVAGLRTAKHRRQRAIDD